ncbi:MAG: 3-oxoacyl-ACP reductase FabG [Chloroflexi bacterium]|nr:MAG: 3-oxoacyl-ACP reductase FabG [Chloroflexota bacterium]
MFRLDGKRAFITGAGRGLGRAIAAGLAERGARVAIGELPERLSDAESAARELGGVAVPLDVRQIASAQTAIAQVLEALGGIDILVNNAGVNRPQDALDVTEEAWDAVLDTDLKGVFFTAQAAARQMRQRGGRIVNIASQNGVVGFPKRAAYCSAKAGVINLTRLLALEWAPYRILVNAVAPTFIETELTAVTLSDPALRDEILSRIPLGHLGTPDDVAAAVIFLASDEARMVTGHTLLVDGGWVAR